MACCTHLQGSPSGSGLLMPQDHNEGSPRSFLHLSVVVFPHAPQRPSPAMGGDEGWVAGASGEEQSLSAAG